MKQQSLAPRTSEPVAEIVRRCAGIQAQVHSAARLAVAQRRSSPEPGEVDRALWQERSIVKTWAMRGTLHLLPADELPNVVATVRSLHPWSTPSWQKYHGLTAAEVERTREAIGEVLSDARVRTREELGAAVAERVRSKRLTPKLGSGWGELLKPAAFAGLLIQGPPRDGRVTYTRPDTWLGSWSEPDPVEAGVALVRLYLRAHGPARIEELSNWWMRQPPSKVRKWFEALGDELIEVDVEGRVSLLLKSDVASLRRQKPNQDVRLLPAFDQYVLAVARDIEALVPAPHGKDVFRTINGWIAPTVVLGGRVVGTWGAAKDSEVPALWASVAKTKLAQEIRRVEASGFAARDDEVGGSFDPSE